MTTETLVPQAPQGSVQEENLQKAPEAPVETQAEAPAEAAPQEDPKLSSRFAALAKKEKAIQEQKQQLKNQEAEIQEYKARFEQFNQAIENIKKDPIAALKEVGITYEELTEAYLRSLDPEYVPTAEDRVKALEEKLTAKEAAEAKAKQEAEEARLKQEAEYIAKQVQAYQDEIKRTVEEKGDTYELIAANNAYDLVYSVVEENFLATQKIMSIDDACEMVEQYLEVEAQKLLNLKKFAKAEQPAEVNVKATTPAAQATPAPTLTHRQQPSPQAPAPKGLTKEDSLKRAASLIRWD